ncbi:MAG TPA: hypothetical protein PKD24_10865 [Pyrinomonadaceae bacterium]|nr:hypothetical protein [Pyrinomonadaceae bacterium]
MRAFGETGVRYLIIGGYAFAEHVEPRYTKDLDIWIDNQDKNAGLVIKALRKFGAPLLDVSESDLMVPTTVYQIGIPPTRIDILAGLERMSFSDCWERRKLVQIDDLSVSYISAEDLLITKQLAGRPQDMIDAEQLRRKLNIS